MWDCRRVVARSGDVVDGRLTLRDRLGLWPHLAVCRGCRRHLRQVGATVGLLRALGAEAPPAEVEAGLRAAFRDRYRSH